MYFTIINFEELISFLKKNIQNSSNFFIINYYSISLFLFDIFKGRPSYEEFNFHFLEQVAHLYIQVTFLFLLVFFYSILSSSIFFTRNN